MVCYPCEGGVCDDIRWGDKRGFIVRSLQCIGPCLDNGVGEDGDIILHPSRGRCRWPSAESGSLVVCCWCEVVDVVLVLGVGCLGPSGSSASGAIRGFVGMRQPGAFEGSGA